MRRWSSVRTHDRWVLKSFADDDDLDKCPVVEEFAAPGSERRGRAEVIALNVGTVIP